ncbi:MAG: transcriptional regulator NrdR [Armatimonadota bacterium]
MNCPFCKNNDDKVLDSREIREGTGIRRRRECMVCGRRFTTYEEVEDLRPLVVKKDQRREPFDRGKILNGMITACEKRPVSAAQLESAVDEIEREIYDREEKEVLSSELGDLVIDKLRQLDRVAYVRFASVYRRFEDVTQFKELVDILDSH